MSLAEDEFMARVMRICTSQFDEDQEPIEALDIGCGTGSAARLIDICTFYRVRYTGVDASPSMIARAHVMLKDEAIDVDELRIGDASQHELWNNYDRDRFHLVMSMYSACYFCHTRNDLASFMIRAQRACAPGGLVVIATPTTRRLRSRRYGLARAQITHRPTTTGWSCSELEVSARVVGLEVLISRQFSGWLDRITRGLTMGSSFSAGADFSLLVARKPSN